MKRYIITLAILALCSCMSANAIEQNDTDTAKEKEATAEVAKDIVKEEKSAETILSDPNLAAIGFHKRQEISTELQIKKIFQDYEKYTNTKDLNGFLSLHDTSYRSADGYDLTRLRQLALDSWKDYPNVKHTVRLVSINIDIDNATVITNEKLSGTTEFAPDYLKGKGFIDSESTAIYYLQRFSNDWKIVSDFVINEKTCMRFGAAKYIPMRLDAPALASPNEEYTAIIKMNVPDNYVALVSLNNEPITFPMEKSTEVFRGLKSNGVRERILRANDGTKNENAVASIAIAQPDISNDMINISIAGIAFLSSRVNVAKHKLAPIEEDGSIEIFDISEEDKAVNE